MSSLAGFASVTAPRLGYPPLVGGDATSTFLCMGWLFSFKCQPQGCHSMSLQRHDIVHFTMGLLNHDAAHSRHFRRPDGCAAMSTLQLIVFSSLQRRAVPPVRCSRQVDALEMQSSGPITNRKR
jgi:hypothetical protein